MRTTNQSDSPRVSFSPDPQRPLQLLQACPFHAPSPLAEIKDPSGRIVLIKDETTRMGLGSFKALGGVYAVAVMIGEAMSKLGKNAITVQELLAPDTRTFASSMTFVCASAGNHGLAVAAGAQIFGAKARIHLSNKVPPEFISRLQAKHAETVISGNTYEESLKAALQDAENTGAILLADGAWPGYTHPPSLVMEGYTVITEELRRAFIVNKSWPSDIYLQAGVGSLAGAITHMIRTTWPVQPRIHIVEPQAAPCLQKSYAAGHPVRAEGPVSNMGRLDCKEPSIIAYEILARSGVEFITISDHEASNAADHLTINGLPTTPSGAAGYAAMIKQQATSGISADFRPLIIVTETNI